MRHLVDLAQDQFAFTMRGVAITGKCGYENGCPWAQVDGGPIVKLESENSMTEAVLVAMSRFFTPPNEQEHKA